MHSDGDGRRTFYGRHTAGELRLTQEKPVCCEVGHLSPNVHRRFTESMPYARTIWSANGALEGTCKTFAGFGETVSTYLLIVIRELTPQTC